MAISLKEENELLYEECIKHLLNPTDAKRILSKCGELGDMGINADIILKKISELDIIEQ